MSKRKKTSYEDRVFDILNYIFLTIILVIVSYPLYFVVISSFSDPHAVNSGKVIFYPVQLTVDGYKRIFENITIWRGYLNSIIYTVLGTLLNVSLTMMIAYPLSRKSFSGRKILTIFIMIPMYFSGGLIPMYLTMKRVGLVNKWPILVLLGAVATYNVIMSRVVLQSSVPDELFEAAEMDGCSQISFFYRFVIPLSKALIAVLTLYYGVGHWNDYFNPLIYLNNKDYFPLQLILRGILVENQLESTMMSDIVSATEAARIADLIKYGVIIVSTLPILMTYPFLQKYFNKGVMMGSLKG